MATEFDDVRMRGFARRTACEDALVWVDAQVAIRSSQRRRCVVPLRQAAGRILAEDVISRCDVPQFSRAMMDGFAVRADDVAGAGPYNRIALTEVGVSLPGVAFEGHVESGQAVRIMTGAPMPDGADAVLPVERTQRDVDTVFALAELSPGKHVGVAGEDLCAGDMVQSTGRRLRPQDVGVLSAIGVAEVPVVARPRVQLVITGNELLPAGTPPTDYQIADANGPMLGALVARDGGEAIYPKIVPDNREAIRDAMHSDAGVVLVSGGSSCGEEDHAPAILASDGKLAIHGIAMRPSSPTGMGTLGERIVFLLPGNPVSCLCAYDFFAGRAIRTLAGLPSEWPYRFRRLSLERKLVSQIGRTDYARVRVIDGKVKPLAIGGASILTSTTRADGFVIVDAQSEGMPPGDEVTVWMYD